MLRVHVHSRNGNYILAAAGALYAVSALALLVFLTADTWGVAGMLDRLMQIGLVVVAACGVWLFLNSRANLRDHASRREQVAYAERADAR